ncbi:MAG: isoaspartyl peptidase/L-asparaginase [Chitinophagaceae bacterium]|nr:isoaspartyl peptidase/L-asparaginase [Chitinophagaceae bacterium]MBP8244944.1 isoaspartyl peptidase/L-asparaginase [Chitinophagaceae bacterium]
MKRLFILFALFILNNSLALAQNQPLRDKFVLVIHGGAGTILKSQMTPEKEKAFQDALNKALQLGNDILQKGGTALDAVEAAVRSMEDNPLFNAGKGAVFTNEGKNELDAAIMNGENLAAGSVAGVTTIKNPISAARAVMEKSPHVMMTGKGAEKFAREKGLEIVDPSYFYTEHRWKALQAAIAEDSTKMKLDHDDSTRQSALKQPENRDYKYGTVGAVALDRHGNLAAATSTGGMTNKKFGRVGDAPIIGAGTYANNQTVAVSGTGWGEYFIRLVMAKSISDMMEFGKMPLKKAADEMVMKRLPALGGDGGLIAVDKDGNIAMPFCTEGMYRGFIDNSGKKEVRIYKD